MVQRHLAGAIMIKALHNQDAPHLYINARPGSKEGGTTLPVAGDDAHAKAIVMTFLDTIGFDSIDAGSLAESWRIEPGTPIYVWPYAPQVPEGMSEEETEVFYVTTPGTPVTPDQARELVAKAIRPNPIGGFPGDLPAVWTAVVGRYAEVAARANNRN